MTENADDTRSPLALEEVAQAVQQLTAEHTLEGSTTRFLESVRRWAAPSAVLAAVRDPAAESGWRLLPALCSGSGPLGAERSVRQLVEELPEDLGRPSLVRPRPEIPGVRMRENCLVPWSCEGESGVLVLRGVVNPIPPNVADAIALLSAPVWPRLLGGPAARVEASVAELRRLAERLRDDADRQIERLQAARPPVVETPREEPAGAGRVEALEEQLTAARGEVDRLAAFVESLRSEKAKEIKEAGKGVARLIVEREALQRQITTLERALGDSEAERKAIRGEADRLAQALEAARAAGPSEAVTGTAEPARASSEAVEACRRALAIFHRTPFIPPPLRVALQAVEVALGEKADRPARWLRVAVLDRDTAGLEPLVAELEPAGLDVKIASHPEELALLLKTPQGRELDAAICDVLAFRPDQTVAGIFRGWEKDRPGLALYLSFSRDSAPEVERAQRVPLSLTTGRFQRPLQRAELMEMLEPLRRPAS